MKKNSLAFWEAVMKIRVAVGRNAAMAEELRTQSPEFLIRHNLDVEITLDETRSTTLSQILAAASVPERGAMLNALFALAFSRTGATPAKLDSGEVTPDVIFCDEWGCGEYNPEDPFDDGGGGGGGGGGPGIGFPLANAAVFINVAAVENAIALANANAVQMTNMIVNQLANANANANTNGLAMPLDPLSVPNRDNNNLSLALPSDFAEGPLSKELRKLGLSLPRQMALIKRAATSALSDSGSTFGRIQVSYTYRSVQFELEGEVSGTSITLSKADLASK